MKIQMHSDSTKSVLSANLMAQSEDSRPLMLESNSADQPTRSDSALLRCLCAFFLVIGIHATSVAGEVVIFGASHIGPDDSTLHRIDPLTGAATAVGTGIGFQRVSGMDFDPTTGILYATGEREAGDLDVNVLMTINVSTGVGTEIGPTGVVNFDGVFSGSPDFEGVFSDLSFRPTDHTLFGFSFPGQWVATIDLVTGEATQLAFESVIGDRGIEANDGNGLAFVDSVLIHAGSEGIGSDLAPSCAPDCPSALHEIDLATDMATTLVTLDFPFVPGFDNDFDTPRANGMDFHPASGTLFASIIYGGAGGGATFLGTIQQSSGDVDLIGETEFGMDALTVISSVDIDIKPGSDMNPVNPNSNGVVMLAILGTSDFDALQVSTTTIRFGPLGAAPAKCKVKDTNQDGLPDLRCKFKIPETGIACGDTEATLVGATFGGQPFLGTDAVKTVGCIVNGTFETGDLTGWTASGINDGFAVVNQEGTCFSFNNTLGLTFNGDFAANVRSSGPAPTSSIGILTSDLFVAGSRISFRALSENSDGAPVPDPVTLEVRVLEPAILDVRDVDTPGADSVLHGGGLTNGVSGFVDRGDNQNWIIVPESLEGADYIESAQNNADVSDDRGTSLLIEVDVAEGAVLYMFIHDDQPATPFPWMNFTDFGADWVDTGLDIFWTFDDSTFDIWRTVGPLDAGTYNFRQMPVDSSFYGIAATLGVGNILLSQIVKTNIVTLNNVFCPGGEPRDGIFSTHIVDTSALDGQAVRVEFRQHTNVPGNGFFTLIDDVDVDPDDD